jgi:hypothetical protein
MCCFQELADFEKMPDEPKIDANGQYILKVLNMQLTAKLVGMKVVNYNFS